MDLTPPPANLSLRDPRNRFALAVGLLAMAALLFGHVHAIRKPPLAWASWVLMAFGALPLAGAVLLDLKTRGLPRLLAGLALALALGGLLLGSAVAPIRAYLAENEVSGLILALSSLGCSIGAAASGRVDLGAWDARLGDWRWWGPRTGALCLAIPIFVGLWVWADPRMREVYPYYKPAREDFGVLMAWCACMALYFLGWEFFWRGFLLRGVARIAGPMQAILFSALPFFLTHKGKPETELVASFFGGLLLAAFCWRSRSFLPGLLLHTTLNTSIQVLCFLW